METAKVTKSPPEVTSLRGSETVSGNTYEYEARGDSIDYSYDGNLEGKRQHYSISNRNMSPAVVACSSLPNEKQHISQKKEQISSKIPPFYGNGCIELNRV